MKFELRSVLRTALKLLRATSKLLRATSKQLRTTSKYFGKTWVKLHVISKLLNCHLERNSGDNVDDVRNLKEEDIVNHSPAIIYTRRDYNHAYVETTRKASNNCQYRYIPILFKFNQLKSYIYIVSQISLIFMPAFCHQFYTANPDRNYKLLFGLLEGGRHNFYRQRIGYCRANKPPQKISR